MIYEMECQHVQTETYPRTAPMMVPAISPPRPRFSLKRPPVTAAHRQSLVSSKVLKQVRTQQVDGAAGKAFWCELQCLATVP